MKWYRLQSIADFRNC